LFRKLDVLSEETQRLACLYEHKLVALDSLGRSLLHQAFSGELAKSSKQSAVLAFPKTVPNVSASDLHAGVLAIAYDLHERANRQKNFGHVKAEKIAHMVEAVAGN